MKLFIKFSDGTVKYTNNITRRKVGQGLQGKLFQNGTIKGTAIVSYSPGYKNTFDFDGKDDFWHKFNPCIEKSLVREFS